MSGVDQDRNMRKKRKTRAERNQMSRHHLQNQKKQKKLSKSLKDMEPSHNTTYTLRSGRSSHTSLVPRDDRKTNTGTITQGRLTRSLGKLTFTNSKTSDWIKRGPISESEAMKEKVENDLKRILWLAERSTLTSNVELLPGTDSVVHEMSKTAALEPDAMEMDCSSNNSNTTGNKNTAETSHQAYIMGAITVPTSATAIASVAVQAQVTPVRSGNSSLTWASTSPVNVDETLQLEPPVQEIADKILKELKPKFARLFPNRDIEMEVCSDLQKLLNHSCHSDDILVNPSLNSFQLPECHDTVNLRNQTIGNPVTTSASTLSVCRPPSFQTEQFYSQLQHCDDGAKPESNGSVQIQDSVLYPYLGSYSSTAFNKNNVAPSFLTSFVVPDLHEADDIIKINMTVDESEDDDSNDVLSTARYNAFLASARELELEQERLLHRVNTFEKIAPSRVSTYHQCIEQDNILRQSCGLKPAETSDNASREINSNSRSFDWKNIRAARVLDFSQPSGTHQHQAAAFACSSRNVSDSLHHNVHLIHPVMTHSRNQLDYVLHTASEQQKSSFLPQSCSPSGRNPFGPGKRYPKPETYSSTVSSFLKRNAAPTVGPNLAQSRLNFQNALNFACRPDDVCHVKTTETMNTDRYGDFISNIQMKTSPLESCKFLSCRHLMSRPLSELQSHQADLQRQARDFLDDLDSCGAKPQLNFINCQPSRSRHLFQIASPDSNGSPVWGMFPVMKDFG